MLLQENNQFQYGNSNSTSSHHSVTQYYVLHTAPAPNDFNNVHTFVNSLKSHVNETLLTSSDAHRGPHHLGFLFFLNMQTSIP